MPQICQLTKSGKPDRRCFILANSQYNRDVIDVKMLLCPNESTQFSWEIGEFSDDIVPLWSFSKTAYFVNNVYLTENGQYLVNAIEEIKC